MTENRLSALQVELEILRYNPETDTEPRFQRYSVPCKNEWCILDALNYLKDHLDPTLAFRWSCHMQVCGSCGMMINGEPKLACKAFVRDYTGVIRIEPRVVDDLGTITLSLFLAMALMSLRLWELFDLALPMLAILSAQVALMAVFAYWITFRVMGRDYDAAVMAGGHCGFGLGATPNAIANMGALEERFGPAPRAFLVVPMVGGMFIDFTNALIISTYINLVRP